MSIADFLSQDHRRCDEALAKTEMGISRGNWEEAQQCLDEFVQATEHHLAMEEEILFPRFEQRTGNTNGPTRVMRGEHREIRAMLAELVNALRARDGQAFLGYADTLNILLQQHNMKEENILYPMAEQVLSDSSEAVIEAMMQVGALA